MRHLLRRLRPQSHRMELPARRLGRQLPGIVNREGCVYAHRHTRAGASPARTLYDMTLETDSYRVRAGLAPALAVCFVQGTGWACPCPGGLYYEKETRYTMKIEAKLEAMGLILPEPLKAP